jgi:hypothetical protein
MPGSAELDLGTNGVNPDQKASLTERFPLTERGRYVQLRLTNTTGRLTVRALGVEAQLADRSLGTTPYQGN